jgi:hypothetical protein
VKGNSNINRGLRFSDMSNRDNSNKDNPRFRNLKVNSQDNNLRKKFSSRNTLSLKENLKERR